jgi:hypothetical protein
MAQVTEAVGVGEDEERPSGPAGPLGMRIRGQPTPGPRRGDDGGNGAQPSLQAMSPAELFARAVRFLRRGRRLRQVDLCARAGMSIGRLSGIEAGEYAAWRGSADQLARALDFPGAVELLLGFYGSDLPVADARSLLEGPADGDP